MDNLKTVTGSGHIDGPAGALYVDNDNQSVQEGIPVLFLHSFGGSTEHWKQQLDHVRTKRQAAAFDFRGHGRSEAAEDANYNVEALVKDVEAVMDELGWPQAILVGHSMGGTAAIAYADAHPTRVAGLVLSGTPGRSDPEQAKQIMAALDSEQYQMVMDEYMKKLLTNARPPTDTLVMAGMQELSKAVSLQVIRGQFAYNPLPALQRYQGPKTIVYSSGEQNQPNALYRQASDIPSQLIADTSHWTQLDKPEKFNEILDRFI